MIATWMRKRRNNRLGEAIVSGNLAEMEKALREKIEDFSYTLDSASGVQGEGKDGLTLSLSFTNPADLASHVGLAPAGLDILERHGFKTTAASKPPATQDDPLVSSEELSSALSDSGLSLDSLRANPAPRIKHVAGGPLLLDVFIPAIQSPQNLSPLPAQPSAAKAPEQNKALGTFLTASFCDAETDSSGNHREARFEIFAWRHKSIPVISSGKMVFSRLERNYSEWVAISREMSLPRVFMFRAIDASNGQKILMHSSPPTEEMAAGGSFEDCAKDYCRFLNREFPGNRFEVQGLVAHKIVRSAQIPPGDSVEAKAIAAQLSMFMAMSESTMHASAFENLNPHPTLLQGMAGCFGTMETNSGKLKGVVDFSIDSQAPLRPLHASVGETDGILLPATVVPTLPDNLIAALAAHQDQLKKITSLKTAIKAQRHLDDLVSSIPSPGHRPRSRL